MKCPACDHELSEMATGDITVDVCQGGCGGLWFERFELKKVDEPHEAAGEALLQVERNSAIRVDPTQRRNCPKCDDIVMMQHFFCVKRQVEIDECPKCAGFWLDPGELATIRSQYDTEEERRQAAEQYFDDVFGDQLAEMRAQKARNFARMFRFICPSNYIPGKQEWGAF